MRVTSAVSDTQRTTLTGVAGLTAAKAVDLGALPDATAVNRMMLQLQPSADQKVALEKLLSQQSDPASTQYHRWLTPQEFGQRFGVGDADIAKVKSWLVAHGMVVNGVSANHRTITFSGNAGAFRTAFATELHSYNVDGARRVSVNAAPQVPTALRPVISGLVSTNDNRHSAHINDAGRFTIDRATGTVKLKSVSSSASSGGAVSPKFTTAIDGETYHIVTPYDFATIYNVKPLWDAGIDGTGQTIAIVARSDINTADVDNFRANFGLPPKKLNIIYPAGNPGIGADVAEAALDVEWSGAVAKNATIDMVVGASSLTTDGVDVAASYIVDNDLAPIVSMSYGECEYSLGEAGNEFYSSLWRQAAAQGQTVFISTGDSGAATCDVQQAYARFGLQVNGLASSPYNVAVGGTDLYGDHKQASAYWSATNDPTTLASAVSYMPELPWDDSCANPFILAALQSEGLTTDTTVNQLCSDSKWYSSLHVTVGGGGGASGCLTTTDGTPATCTGGYPKPTWQMGPGVPADGVRDLPDVSLFSGDGVWGVFLPYCVTSATVTGTCDMTQSTDIQGAGGTSFASPQFAGIMALINQKTSGSQGNANPVFYQLAAAQSALNCSTDNPSSSLACIFHDVDQGTNAQPCFAFPGYAGQNCTPLSGGFFGVNTGYSATAHYDQATGLGSVNVTNLVNAWATLVSNAPTTSTALTLSTSAMVYGANVQANVAVTSAGAGVPSGLFSVVPADSTTKFDESPGGSLTAGKGVLTLNLLPAGTYDIKAHYQGDGTFLGSDSQTQTITITKATTSLTVTSSKDDTLAVGDSTLLTMSVTASGAGDAPSGTVTVVDGATGSTLGSVDLTAAASGPTATAVLSVPAAQLQGGANQLSINYGGDDNYAAASSSRSVSMTAPMAISLASDMLTLDTSAAAATASTTATVSAPAGSAVAYPVTLSCVGTLPSGTSCNLSKTVLTSAADTSSVTIARSTPVAIASPMLPVGPTAPALLSGLGFLTLLRRQGRRYRLLSALLLCAAFMGLDLTACGGDGGGTTQALPSIAVSASATKVPYGNGVSFTAALGANGATPSGTVTWLDATGGQNKTLGVTSVSGGVAVLTVGQLDLGAHSVSALYSGDTTYGSTASAPIQVAVFEGTTVQIKAVDANGYTAVATLGVTIK